MTPVLDGGTTGRAGRSAGGMRRARCVAALALVVGVGNASASYVERDAVPSLADSRLLSQESDRATTFQDDGSTSVGLLGPLWRIGTESSRSFLFGPGLAQPFGLEIAAGEPAPTSKVEASVGIAAVPEPAMVTLLFTGLAALISALRRRSGARSTPKALPEPQPSVV